MEVASCEIFLQDYSEHLYAVRYSAAKDSSMRCLALAQEGNCR